MSEGGNIVAIADAFKNAKTRKKSGGSGEGPPPDGRRPVPPPLLPDDAPVKALGVNGRELYFLNCRGQFVAIADKDVGRLAMLNMFGSVHYLTATWPKYDRSGKHVINWDTGLVSEAMVVSCSVKGIWSPEENVRGVGTWAEEQKDGTSVLVMHCGDKLFLSNAFTDVPGLRDRLLYPAAPPQPHPEAGVAGGAGPAGILLDKLRSWNWQRGEVDAMLHLGWIMSAILGAAPDWRPVEWITGGTGTGKSTLFKLTRWVFGANAMIKSEDATPAGVKQKVANSALPVSLDELESEGDNRRQHDLIKLARIASSGGESVRGSPEGASKSFVSRNCFQFSSITIPSLRQQDKNRLFIGALDELSAPARSRDKTEQSDDDERDPLLGDRAEWERVGRRLRGRALKEWPRYKKTLKAYARALAEVGHNARGCDQFAALGAAYDIAMFDGFEEARAKDWAEELPASQLAETSGYSKSHEACLLHLLGAPVEVYKGGAKETVAQLLATARDDMRGAVSSNSSTAHEALQGIGIKLMKDPRDDAGQAVWVCVANSHAALLRIFRETDWSGLPGAPGAWSQMMQRLGGAMTKNARGNPLRLKFQRVPLYCTAVPWETVFSAEADDDAQQFESVG
jgi:hypothetical protein